jgi:hypothetical protein
LARSREIQPIGVEGIEEEDRDGARLLGRNVIRIRVGWEVYRDSRCGERYGRATLFETSDLLRLTVLKNGEVVNP